MAVFVRSEAQLDRARQAVKVAGLGFCVLDDKVRPEEAKVSICTMHLAKGLEFRAVVVMACNHGIAVRTRAGTCIAAHKVAVLSAKGSLMGHHGSRRLRGEVQKVQPRKAFEIAVKRHQPTVADHRKGGQVGIGPEVVDKAGRARERTVAVVKARRLGQPANDGQRQKLPVGDPGFVGA